MAINVSLSKKVDGRLISVSVEELADEGRLRFTATVDGADGGFAGIQAILFDIEDAEVTNALFADGDDVVGSQFSFDGVLNPGDGANSEGDDRRHNDFFPFDAGVAIGPDGANFVRILSTTFTVGSSGRALTLDDLDLDRVGVKIASVASGESHQQFESVELKVRRGIPLSSDGEGSANDEAALGADDFVDAPENSTGIAGGTVRTGSDDAFAEKTASIENVDAAFAPLTFKGVLLEPLNAEATTIVDFGRSEPQTDARVSYILGQSPLGQVQIGQDTDELAGTVDRSPGGGLRKALSEKIMSDDPALKSTDVGKFAAKSGISKTAVEQPSGSDNNFGLDFRIFIDGGSDEMLF